MPSGVEFIIKQQVFPTRHTDAHNRLYVISIHHKPHFPQITSVFKPSQAIRSRRCLVCRCGQRSAGCGGHARTATRRRATSGDRVVRRLVCASCFPYMFRLTSLGVSSVSLVCGSMAVMRRAFVPQRSSKPGFFVDPCCTVASVRNRLHASGIGSARRRGCGKYLARHAFLADSVVIVLLVPSHASNDLSFFAVSCGFFAVSLAAFVIWCCLPRKICLLFCSHVHVSSPIETTGKQTPAAPELHLLKDPLGSAISRNILCTCLSRHLWRVHSITTNPIQAFS